MSAPGIRAAIPAAYADLDAWPRLDPLVLTAEDREPYTNRCTAIEMYAKGFDIADITQRTGKSKSELYRLIKRCVTLAPDGRIYGFRALGASVPVTEYHRRADVVRIKGSGSAGCAGALTQLLSRFPEINELIKDLYFKRGSDHLHESRIAMCTIHEHFQDALRQLGFTDAHWPFNTSNRGYKTLCVYCNWLRESEPASAVDARSGAEAGRRSAIGKGKRPILPCVRPYSVVQLDFHKVDSASIIVLKNDYGHEFEVPLSRWHFGLMAEEKSGAALGYCVALELTPSGDSTLETVSSALSSQSRDFADILALSKEHVLVNQLMPDLAYQGFSILKVDNGWANAAHEVVNNIMSTVGCAVNFGPTRAWWRRSLIERIFGELTRRGLQRLPSTHGKGPGDTRINNPNLQAAVFRISLSDLIGIFKRCLREHNLTDSEGKQWTSPIQCLQAAYTNPRSGFFSQPLPVAAQTHMALMMHMEEVAVCGDVNKGIRPFFRLDRHIHTNDELAHAYWLIGKTLVVYVERRLARIVYATVKDTGHQLGRMYVSGPFADSDCSWRDRKLLNRAGMAARNAHDGTDPLEEFKQEKMTMLKERKKSQRNKSSKTALDVARIEAQQMRAPLCEPEIIGTGEQDAEDESSPEVAAARPASDPFGLYDIPNTGTI